MLEGSQRHSRNQTVWNPKQSFGKKRGYERAAFAHRLLDCRFTLCHIGSHLQSWLWEDFWEYVRVSGDQENGMWMAMFSHQQWHSHKERSSPLLTSDVFNFLSRSRNNIKGWGRRKNGPCKRGHIKAVFLFNYFRPFLAVLASLVHCSWESCRSIKMGFSSFLHIFASASQADFFHQPTAENTVFKVSSGCKHQYWCQGLANDWKPSGYPSVVTQTAYKQFWSVLIDFSLI